LTDTVDGWSGYFPGVPYAYAASAGQGDLIFTADACPLDEQGRVVAQGDVRAQTGRYVAMTWEIR
jgi:enamine deaminase RidA (YjgF/YER057c/UK114 family)